jgi:thiamine-monophosphate kinase
MIEDKTTTHQHSTTRRIWIDRPFNQNFKINQPSTLKGIGDDAAVLDFKDKKVVVSTDLLIEGVHFDLAHAFKTFG